MTKACYTPAHLALLFLLLLLTASCSSSSAEEGHAGHEGCDHGHDHGHKAPEATPPAAPADEHEGCDHGAAGNNHAGHNHAGHAHGEHGSDLDRPLEELFAARCEHRIPTYTCAECRYEVGVARVPARLIKEGLIRLAPATRRRGESVLNLTGEIVLDEGALVQLSPLTAGLVTRTLVELGQRVKAGEPLLVLHSPELARVQAEFLEADSRLLLATRTSERLRNLRASGASSQRELLEAEQELESARIRRLSARQELVILGMRAAEADALGSQGMTAARGELTLRAPLSGVVLELPAAAPGSRIDPGERAALIGDPSRLWVWADLYERDLTALEALRRKEGTQVTVQVAAYPGEMFEGVMDFLAPRMDPATRTFKLRVRLANPDARLYPGMYARVQVRLAAGTDSLVVPSAAVLADEGREFVFIRHRDDYFVRRPVLAGRRDEGLTEIRLGLEDGQSVVAEGSFLLKSDVLRSKMGAGCAD